MTARMKIGEADDQPKKETRQSINGLLAAGGIIAALGASSCCVVPLALLALGISGAWIGNLTAFAPYQPLFVTAAIGCLAVRFFARLLPTKGVMCERHLLHAPAFVAPNQIFPVGGGGAGHRGCGVSLPCSFFPRNLIEH
ncbi:MerT mercuric transport protein [Rhizobium azibense]|nr:MerT mercuric transport protein [Rhizobium azibense]